MSTKGLKSALNSTAFGASLFTVGRILSSLLSFIVNFLLTNLLGPASFGIFAYSQTILTFTLDISDFGTDKALIRYLPEYEQDSTKQAVIFGLSLFLVFLASTTISLLLLKFAPLISKYSLDTDAFVTVLRVFALILPFKSLTRVLENSFRALNKPKFQLGISEFLEPISKLVAAIITVVFTLTVRGAAIAFLVSTALLFLVAISTFLSQTSLRPSVTGDTTEISDFLKFSLPLTLNSAGYILTNHVDILMVGIFLSSSAVGYYRVAGLLAGIVSLPLTGLNQIFPPQASKLYANNEFDALQQLYRVTTRWSITATIPVAVGLVVYRTEVLSLFGNEFMMAKSVLVILVVSGVFHAFAGPCGLLLMMTDHQYLAMVNNWLLAILNVILNVYFIKKFGFIGAAVATTISVVCFNSLKILEVWYLEGMLPYSRKLYKPVLAAVILFLCLHVTNSLADSTFVTSPPVLFVAGSTFGVSTYLVSLFLLGLETADKNFLDHVLPERVFDFER